MAATGLDITTAGIALGVISLIVCALIIVGNLCTIIAVARTKIIQTLTNAFVVHLAIADIIIGISSSNYAMGFLVPNIGDTSNLNIRYVCFWRFASFSMSMVLGVTSLTSIAILKDYGINSILYQRGLYPPESFQRVQKYGLTLLVTTDKELNNYLMEIISQMKDWLNKMTVQKLVVVIKSIDTNEVLERWQFDVECDKSAAQDSQPRSKSENDINREICSVIRQITATVTFLPLLEEACVFDLLVYTDKDLNVPDTWGESGPLFVNNSEEVRLRSFMTTIHKVDTMVSYKKND